jgi:hypothetical protein
MRRTRGTIRIALIASLVALAGVAPAGPSTASHVSPTYDTWQSLGGIITATPDVGHLDGSDYYVARGRDNGIWIRRVDQGHPTNWMTIGGLSKGGPAVSDDHLQDAQPAGGRVDVFVRGLDDALWYRTGYSNGGPITEWSPWRSLGGIITADPAAVAFRSMQGVSGELHVFARGTDGKLWRREGFYWPGDRVDAWGAWTTPLVQFPPSLGVSGPGAGGLPSASANRTGVVVVRDAGDQILYAPFTSNSSPWTPDVFGPYERAGTTTERDLDAELTCRIELFAYSVGDGSIIRGRPAPRSPTNWEFLGGRTPSGVGSRFVYPSDWIVAVQGLDNALWSRRHNWANDC